jgi:hypothetical protein
VNIVWKPGQGIDLAAVERMKQHFPKPTKPSFEAWFMNGEIKYVNWLTDLPVDQYDLSELENYLFDTGAGIKNFELYEEWINWYLFLLPHLSLRITEGDLLCRTLTYFFNIYPDQIVEEYPGFRDDVLKVLPYYIMSTDLYENGDLAYRDDLYQWFGEGEKWSNALPETMFFCLKYLTPQEIAIWIESLSFLKAGLLKDEIDIWIARAKRLFNYILHPELVPRNTDTLKKIKDEGLRGYFYVSGFHWRHSDLIIEKTKSGIDVAKQINNYLPQANIDAFLAAIKQYKFDL